MRDKLPQKVNVNESGVVNTDSYDGDGEHWVAYVKKGSVVQYFDSYGNLKPPKELVKYFRSRREPVNVLYNHKRYQKFNAVNCGHLCLQFIYKSYKM